MGEARLSEVLGAFNSEVSKLDAAERSKIRQALDGAATPAKPPSRTLADGTEVKRFDVSLSALEGAVPGFLRDDARRLARAFGDECAMRGPAWAAEAAHLAIPMYLDFPTEAEVPTPAHTP